MQNFDCYNFVIMLQCRLLYLVHDSKKGERGQQDTAKQTSTKSKLISGASVHGWCGRGGRRRHGAVGGRRGRGHEVGTGQPGGVGRVHDDRLVAEVVWARRIGAEVKLQVASTDNHQWLFYGE